MNKIMEKEIINVENMIYEIDGKEELVRHFMKLSFVFIYTYIVIIIKIIILILSMWYN